MSNPSNPLGENPPACTDVTCGVFTLTVSIPSTDFNTYRARVVLSWTNSGTTTQLSSTSDYDLNVYAPDVTGSEVGSGAGQGGVGNGTAAVQRSHAGCL